MPFFTASALEAHLCHSPAETCVDQVRRYGNETCGPLRVGGVDPLHPYHPWQGAPQGCYATLAPALRARRSAGETHAERAGKDVHAAARDP
jgi:hypothetical protein